MVVKFLIPATIFNFFLNGGIGYLTFSGSSSVPSWGDPSVGADTIGTTFEHGGLKTSGPRKDILLIYA